MMKHFSAGERLQAAPCTGRMLLQHRDIITVAGQDHPAFEAAQAAADYYRSPVHLYLFCRFS